MRERFFMGLDMSLITASKELAEKMYQWHIDNGYWDEKYVFWYRNDGIIGKWRKANAIHRWFVENIQYGEDNCYKYQVFSEDLNELKELCEKILKDQSLASKLLPTMDGFFFGSIEYDEWYMENVKYTFELINFLLENLEEREEEYSDWSIKTSCFKDDSSYWDVRLEYFSSW